MASLLLAVIYLAFISLGLPDSLLGSAWPVLHQTLSVPVSYAGFVTMIISGGTIISSLSSDFLIKKLRTGWVVAISVALTAVAMFGFSTAKTFYALCLWAIPYGLGAGAIDSALNNYVALHYSSRHMSWLHCFWGVGAVASPYIMSYALTHSSWTQGYRIVSYIQFGLTCVMLAALPLWRANDKNDVATEETPSEKPKSNIFTIFKIAGVPFILVGFFAYCSLESTAMVWASTFLVNTKGISVELGAALGSLFYIGMAVGRFITGFFAKKFGDRNLIRLGYGVVILSLILILLPVKENLVAFVGFVMLGLGCAPIYPAFIHSTPDNFGKENSQSIIGVQMAFAYVGTTFMPPLFGVLAEKVNISLMPYWLMFFLVLMIILGELGFAKCKKDTAIY